MQSVVRKLPYSPFSAERQTSIDFIPSFLQEMSPEYWSMSAYYPTFTVVDGSIKSRFLLLDACLTNDCVLICWVKSNLRKNDFGMSLDEYGRMLGGRSNERNVKITINNLMYGDWKRERLFHSLSIWRAVRFQWSIRGRHHRESSRVIPPVSIRVSSQWLSVTSLAGK